MEVRMLKKAKAAMIVAGMAVSNPAYAQYWSGGRYWVRQPDGGWIGYSGELVFIVFVVLIVAIFAAGYHSTNATENSDTCESVEEQAQRYEEEARLTRAYKAQVDAHTELMASAIDAARMQAAYDDLKQITQHDRDVRRLTHRS
jgi:hypothetical protein